MNGFAFRKETIILAGLLVLVLNRTAFGYIDPGTGSFILQVLLGSLLGMAFAVKMFWRQIRHFFVSAFSKRKNNDGED